MWLSQQADGTFEKEWCESVLPSASLILPDAAWRACAATTRGEGHTQVGHLKVVVRSVVDTHMFAVPWRMVSAENVSRNIHKSLSDLFNSTDEITSKLLAANEKALAAELKNIGEHGKSLSLSGALSFPVLASAHIEAYNLLGAQEGLRDPPWAGRCLVVRGLLSHAVHVALDAYVVEGASCRCDSISGEVFGPL